MSHDGRLSHPHRPDRTGLGRCAWAASGPAIAYHDREWGVPCHDERALFELLILEGAQAGLSWDTILHKREGYRHAFEGFDPARVAAFDAGRVQRLMQDRGIVRNRRKIEAAVNNAARVLELEREGGSLASFVWAFVDHRPRSHHWTTLAEVPARSPESEAMSRALKRRGFRFAGPTICYAFMQASGMVNDHLACCFRHAEILARHG